MTLTELMVTVSLLVLVLAALLSFLDNMNRAVLTETERSRANDEARLAIERLDREVRSSNYVYDPANEVTPYRHLSLRIYTQANAPTRTPGFQCVQYRIQNGSLLRRSWPTAQPGSASSWQTVAENIVNAHPTVNQAAFKMDNNAETAFRSVDVIFYVDINPTDADSEPVRLETTLTGRNVPSGYTSGVCEPAPAG
ncbi:MAG TPA: hypothetical protein VG602_07180 [Actinomycetota bacterium]|nr:hypothetical protein [Actinomycetota bacterium]